MFNIYNINVTTTPKSRVTNVSVPEREPCFKPELHATQITPFQYDDVCFLLYYVSDIYSYVFLKPDAIMTVSSVST